MSAGNRPLLLLLALVIVVAVCGAFALDWSGRQGSAAFVAIATTALGVICPSPLRRDPEERREESREESREERHEVGQEVSRQS